MKRTVAAILLLALALPAYAGSFDDDGDDRDQRKEETVWDKYDREERKLQRGIEESQRRIDEMEREHRERQMIEEMRRLREDSGYRGQWYPR